MLSAQIWTGQEVVHLGRFLAILRSARGLIGRDDHLANLLLEDAIEELQCVLGERAMPATKLRQRTGSRTGASSRRR